MGTQLVAVLKMECLQMTYTASPLSGPKGRLSVATKLTPRGHYVKLACVLKISSPKSEANSHTSYDLS